MPTSTALCYVVGMHGLGDNLHQRALIRQLLGRSSRVLLETPWPCLYHDFAGKLELVHKRSQLRTQAKNAHREFAKFDHVQAPFMSPDIQLKVFYTGASVKASGSILGAMLADSGLEPTPYDFRMPIPASWQAKAQVWIDQWKPSKPLLIYRPLVVRTEWRGCGLRNTDHAVYSILFNDLSERFFVVGVADLMPQVEWLVGMPVKVDVRCYGGELDIETLAALTQRAALVYSSSGFAIPLAQAVGTPSICIFGGLENSSSLSLGGNLTPYLGIDPVQPCSCFSPKCPYKCSKRIDIRSAQSRIERFVDHALAHHSKISLGH